MNRADLGIRSRGSCGDSDDVMWLEPVLAEIERSLHVINARTMLQDRILFGSDWPVLTPERWLEEFDQHSFPDDVKHKILLTNAQRLFELD